MSEHNFKEPSEKSTLSKEKFCMLTEELSNYFLIGRLDLSDEERDILEMMIEEIVNEYYFAVEQIEKSFKDAPYTGPFTFSVDGERKEFPTRFSYTRHVFESSESAIRMRKVVKYMENLRIITANLLNIAWLHLYLSLECYSDRARTNLPA